MDVQNNFSSPTNSPQRNVNLAAHTRRPGVDRHTHPMLCVVAHDERGRSISVLRRMPTAGVRLVCHDSCEGYGIDLQPGRTAVCSALSPAGREGAHCGLLGGLESSDVAAATASSGMGCLPVRPFSDARRVRPSKGTCCRPAVRPPTRLRTGDPSRHQRTTYRRNGTVASYEGRKAERSYAPSELDVRSARSYHGLVGSTCFATCRCCRNGNNNHLPTTPGRRSHATFPAGNSPCCRHWRIKYSAAVVVNIGPIQRAM